MTRSSCLLSTHRGLRATLVAVGLGALSAACVPVSPDWPRDVGNMAYPQPLTQGNLSSTRTAGRQPFDTGSMAYPAPAQAGIIGQTTVARAGFDTGNMAYPAPRPQALGQATAAK